MANGSFDFSSQSKLLLATTVHNLLYLNYYNWQTAVSVIRQTLDSLILWSYMLHARSAFSNSISSYSGFLLHVHVLMKMPEIFTSQNG